METNPDLLRQTVRDMARERNLPYIESSCEVVESLVLSGAKVNYKGEWTRSAWEMAFSHFDQAIEVRDNDLFPDWQLVFCRLLLYLLHHGGDPNARIECRVGCPFSGRLLVDERSTLCIVEVALQAFSYCRVSGIEQLLAAITVLRDQLCSAGAESVSWLNGHRVQSSSFSGLLPADKEVYVSSSGSSILTSRTQESILSGQKYVASNG